MDVETAVANAGTMANLARILSVTPSAVWQWRYMKKGLPELQRYRLKEIKPEWFCIPNDQQLQVDK